MRKYLDYTSVTSVQGEISITGSKSESNRWLILQKFYPQITLDNLSSSEDTQVLIKALTNTHSTIDIAGAGTAMRFLTAYFASTEGSNILLTGNSSLINRPIQPLVTALKDLGADIKYVNKNGYPPLKIKGKKLSGGSVKIPANISSQFISALILIAPQLENGLEIHMTQPPISKPYLLMSISILKKAGIQIITRDNSIKIFPNKEIKKQLIKIESDWTSLSYYYAISALVQNSDIFFEGYFPKSIQGDSRLPEIFAPLGVQTHFENKGIRIKKIRNIILPKHIKIDLTGQPDLAQTLAVVYTGLGINSDITGLKTLKIKETDRLQALKNELIKIGANVRITNNSIHIKAPSHYHKKVVIDTYNDHRMAMAFAPLSIKVPLTINNSNVVIKSYPEFWEHWKKLFIKKA
jgi:3-phosphoshikimate 1-carboxyvinyltransferase